MANCRLDEADSMSALIFLAAFKLQAYNKGIFEVMAKLVLPYFLTGNVCTVYDSDLRVDAIDGSSVRIESWSEATN